MVLKSEDYRIKQFTGFSYLLAAVGERMMVALIEFQKGDEVESHEHPTEQAGYCLSGRFELKVSDKEYVVEPGDSYLIPGDTIHSCHFIQDSQMVEVFSPPRK